MPGESFSGLAFGFRSLSLPAFIVAMAFSIAGAIFDCKRCVKGPAGKASGFTWIRGMLWVCAQR